MSIQIAEAQEVAAEITRKVKVKVGAKSIRTLTPAVMMNGAIQRETARSDRNGREFALVLFRIRPGKQHALSTMRLARTVLTRSRLTDEVGWFDDQFLCAILPDTLASGAWHFAEDVCAIIAERGPRPIYTVYNYPNNWFNADKDGQNRNDPPPPSNSNRRSNELRSGDATPGQRRAEVNDLMPPFLSGVDREFNSELDGDVDGEIDRPIGQPEAISQLIVRPMPIWKRALDLFGATIAIIIFSPFMILAAAFIKLTEPKGSILFLQDRAGLGGKSFKCFKFRTMIADAEKMKDALRKHSEQDGPAFKMKNDPRVTRVGRFLRKTSLDELPQLFNVIQGTMTLVGPRPLPLKEAANCQQWQRRRLDVTPGMTCIWQVSGRSTVSFAEWIRMDVAYMRRRTIWHDLWLILITFPAVILRRGAS